MTRRITALAVLTLALILAAPAVYAQEAMADENYVRVQEPTFTWTGKQDQNANFSWSATISNPYKRPVEVNVTLELLNAAGEVVSTDSQTVSVAKESSADVSGEASLAYASASQATQYRVVIAAAD